MSGVSPMGQHTMPVFISQIKDLSTEISKGSWKGQEDRLADQVLHLFRSNVDLFDEPHEIKNVEFTGTVLNLLDTLNGIEIKSQKVTTAIKRLTNIIQSECGGAPGSLDDLKTLPSDTKEEIKESLKELRSLVKDKVVGAKQGFADWIAYNGLSLSKLDLSKEELLDLSAELRLLNIDIETFTEAEIHQLIGMSNNLQKLVLNTDAVKTTPRTSCLS